MIDSNAPEWPSRSSFNRTVIKEPDGAYRAEVVFELHEFLQVRFEVVPGTVAIMHTHPNSFGAMPSPQDRKNADLLQIPTFTMTNRGLWVYDPRTRKTSPLLPMLSWLDPNCWPRNRANDGVQSVD